MQGKAIAAPKVEAFQPPSRLLMGPGPSDVAPEVSRAMSQPLIGHLDPAFIGLMDEIRSMLRYVMQTENKITFPVSATGMAGMETCVVNVIEPGDKILVCVNGVFGMRMKDVAARAGAEVVTIERPWGEVFTTEELRTALAEHRPKVVGVVHAETSTGALQPLEDWGKICHESGALLLVDAVTSVAGVPLLIDEWEIDVAYAGTQKCLSAPPGLSPVTFSERAMTAIRDRQRPVQSWYMDVGMVESYWAEGAKRSYHHTAPVAMLYGLHAALKLVCDEGLAARWARHQEVHEYLRARLSEHGLKYAADENHLLPPLNAVFAPAEEATIRSTLLTQHGNEIGGGRGAFAGKVWRIGIMGASCTRENVDRLLDALSGKSTG